MRRIFCVFFSACCALTLSARAQPWNAADQFDPLHNPSTLGPWDYGFSVDVTGAFQPYSTPSTEFYGMDTWNRGTDRYPLVFHNSSGSPVPFQNGVAGINQLGLHPTSGNGKSAIRWTAPFAGRFTVDAVFTGLENDANADADVHVLKNSAVLYSDMVVGFGDQAVYGANLTLNAGDTLAFKVGNAGDDILADSVGLEVTIVPEPVVFGLLFPLLACCWRRRRIPI